MTSTLRYGTDSEVTFDLSPEALLAECGQPETAPIDDAAAAVAAALISPLGLPPIAQCILPDDRVAIVLDDDIPQATELLVGALQTLLEANVDPSGIAVICSDRYAGHDFTDQLQRSCGHAIAVKFHDPKDRDELAYLGTSTEGKDVYVNRTIVDAEAVLPIGCLRVDTASGYYGIHSGLFPAFSDEEARERFAAPSNEEWSAHRRRRREEAEEVARRLGVMMTIQIAPGGQGAVSQVLAGEPAQIAKQGQEICDALWNAPLPHRASLVVAGIEGGPESQTWNNVARAIAAASEAVADEGAIAICSELSCPPGPALQKLRDLRDFESTLLELKKDRSDDVGAAIQLLYALDRVRIYFVSQLDEEVVEELGMAPIMDLDDLGRLSQRHESCVLLSNAQYAAVTTNDEL